MIGHVLLVSVLFLTRDSVPTSYTATAIQTNTKLAAIQERISKTSEDGLRIIERVKRLKPVVSEQPSAARLIDVIDEYSAKKGRYNIIPVGWEASQKDDGRWKIVFYYQDFMDRYKAAEWEYDEEINKVYPFERDNAPQFWTSVSLEKKQP